MSNDIMITIRGGLVAVVRDAAGNPLDVTVRDYDVDHNSGGRAPHGRRGRCLCRVQRLNGARYPDCQAAALRRWLGASL